VSKNKVEVRIAGSDYTIVGPEPEEYMHKIGLFVDKRITEIMRGNSRLSTTMSAILTAMNIADEYFKAQEKADLLDMEIQNIREELNKLKEEKLKLVEENSLLKSSNSALQLELAKKEAELKEVRNALEKRNSQNRK